MNSGADRFTLDRILEDWLGSDSLGREKRCQEPLFPYAFFGRPRTRSVDRGSSAVPSAQLMKVLRTVAPLLRSAEADEFAVRLGVLTPISPHPPAGPQAMRSAGLCSCHRRVAMHCPNVTALRIRRDRYATHSARHTGRPKAMRCCVETRRVVEHDIGIRRGALLRS
jgi:hypothetical protein